MTKRAKQIKKRMDNLALIFCALVFGTSLGLITYTAALAITRGA